MYMYIGKAVLACWGGSFFKKAIPPHPPTHPPPPQKTRKKSPFLISSQLKFKVFDP